MKLHTDIPTRAQVDRLLDGRHPASVSIYLSTDPASTGQAERTALGNLASEAERQLAEAGLAKADVSAIRDELDDLADDSEFWRLRRAVSRCSRRPRLSRPSVCRTGFGRWSRCPTASTSSRCCARSRSRRSPSCSRSRRAPYA